jgi:hypothetical protein
MTESGRRKEQAGTKFRRSALREVSLYGALAFLIILASTAAKAQSAPASAGKSDVTAIDISLEPDATMLKYAAANNARLLKVYPKGFALDAYTARTSRWFSVSFALRTSKSSTPLSARFCLEPM